MNILWVVLGELQILRFAFHPTDEDLSVGTPVPLAQNDILPGRAGVVKRGFVAGLAEPQVLRLRLPFHGKLRSG